MLPRMTLMSVVAGTLIGLLAVEPSVATTVDPDGAVSVTTRQGRVLVDRWKPTADPNLRCAIESQPGGFDVVYRSVPRSSPDPVDVTQLPTPPIKLGPSIAAYDFEGSGWPELLSAPGDRIQGTYPNELYSPLAVLRTADIAVGVSVLYPVLEYRHDLAFSIEAMSSSDWQVRISTGRPTRREDLWWGNAAKVPAGESWIWRTCIRFEENGGDWPKTLQPYLAWYQQRYGRVAYQRDPRPIRGFAFASPADQSPDNPEGWARSIGRPDIEGFDKAIRQVEDLAGRWPRVIAWAPTGLATKNKELNYPHQFASRWTSEDCPNRELFRKAPIDLKSMQIPSTHRWGLWWGHAAEQTPGFDRLPQTRVAPDRPASMAEFMRELGCATETGATLIGLDAFAHSHNPIWNLVPILLEMKRKAPSATFCTEGRACDVLHRLAPTWLDAYRTKPFRSGGHERIKGAFILADLVNPGHETWAGMVYDRSSDPSLFGSKPDPAALRWSVRRIAEYGYVPVLFADIDVDVYPLNVK